VGAGAIKARILVCIGADDPFIPANQRAEFESEMRDAGADWEMQVYGTYRAQLHQSGGCKAQHARGDPL
jgi:dienelactone hydrolase